MFAIGVVDDITSLKGAQYAESKQHKMNIAKNAATIRDFIKQSGADNVVIEMCDERYEEELADIIAHPNYDFTMNNVHKFLSRKKPEKILRHEEHIAVNSGNFEFLVALDTCSYRSTCKTTLGDRNFSVTQKRYQAKSSLIDQYKEQM